MKVANIIVLLCIISGTHTQEKLSIQAKKLEKSLLEMREIWVPQAKVHVDAFIKKIHLDKKANSIKDAMKKEYDSIINTISKIYIDLFMQHFSQETLSNTGSPVIFLKERAHNESLLYLKFRRKECSYEGKEINLQKNKARCIIS